MSVFINKPHISCTIAFPLWVEIEHLYVKASLAAAISPFWSHENLVLSKELVKVKLPPWKIWKAEASSVSPLSFTLTLEICTLISPTHPTPLVLSPQMRFRDNVPRKLVHCRVVPGALLVGMYMPSFYWFSPLFNHSIVSRLTMTILIYYFKLDWTNDITYQSLFCRIYLTHQG